MGSDLSDGFWTRTIERLAEIDVLITDGERRGIFPLPFVEPMLMPTFVEHMSTLIEILRDDVMHPIAQQWSANGAHNLAAYHHGEIFNG